jgi:D-methionine transport system permease protein
MITFDEPGGHHRHCGRDRRGGLGDFGIRYGYQMGYRDMIWLTVLIILVIISIFQFAGNAIIRRTKH